MVVDLLRLPPRRPGMAWSTCGSGCKESAAVLNKKTDPAAESFAASVCRCKLNGMQLDTVLGGSGRAATTPPPSAAQERRNYSCALGWPSATCLLRRQTESQRNSVHQDVPGSLAKREA